MNAYENMEIWWITGAQLLYGGDAVVQVDSHSKQMVDGLNNSGNPPDFHVFVCVHDRMFPSLFLDCRHSIAVAL